MAEGFARGPDLQDNGSPDLDLRRRRISTEGECRAQVSARRREPRCPPGGASQRPASGEKKFAYSVGDLTKMPTVAILAPIAKWAFAYPKWQPLLEIA